MTPDINSQLSPGDYTITPSEKMREESGIPMKDVLSGDFDFVSEAANEEKFHKYTVEGGDGNATLEIFETHGSVEYNWLPFSLTQYVYLFVRPAGDPCLVVEVDHGWYPSYSILDPQIDEPLGTVAKTRKIIGDWQLQSPAGKAKARAEKSNSVGDLASTSTYETYAVSGADGEQIAQFARIRAEGDFTDTFRSAMTVSCSPSRMSPELCLAFAFALLNEGTKSSSGGGTEGGV